MTIAIDIDEVLADLNPHFIAFLNHTYGYNLTRESFTSSHVDEVLKCTPSEALEKIHAFYASPEFRSIKPLRGAVQAVQKLASNHRLIVITARHDELADDTRLFLTENFGEHLQEVLFTNHTSLSGPTTTKAEICARYNADYLIDDNIGYALECSALNIQVLLLDAPWNQIDILPTNVVRVMNWDEIIHIIEETHHET